MRHDSFLTNLLHSACLSVKFYWLFPVSDEFFEGVVRSRNFRSMQITVDVV
jgi:hypothetical protein